MPIKHYLDLGQQIYTRRTLAEYRRMAVFVMRSLASHGQIEHLAEFFQESPLRADIAGANPFLFEQPIRSFFFRGSTLPERIALIEGHFRVCDACFSEAGMRRLYLGEGVTLWRTEHEGQSLSLDLGFASGHRKEGLLALTLHLGPYPIYRVIFWLAPGEGDEAGLWIGALQGSCGGLEINRKLTKSFYGCRPKNLVLHVVLVLARLLGVRRVFAVSDHGYFTNNHVRLDRQIKTSLDETWLELGGAPCPDRRFFELPREERRKSLVEIESSKRSLYRKRFALLDEVDTAIEGVLGWLVRAAARD